MVRKLFSDKKKTRIIVKPINSLVYLESKIYYIYTIVKKKKKGKINLNN